MATKRTATQAVQSATGGDTAREGKARCVPGLEVGQSVSMTPILRPNKHLIAFVRKASQKEIVLKFPKPISELPFDEGERVHIHYWENEILYCWDAELIETTRSNTRVVVAIRGEGTTVQRRKSIRIAVKIPLDVTIVEAAEKTLMGRTIFDCTTQNVSVNGLKFETDLPLDVGDRLQITLRLNSSQETHVFGWIVRSELREDQGQQIKSVAVKFLHLREEDQIRLLQFLIGCQE